MALSAGDRLGPYEILAPLGAGGMGEVYKANDTKLDREVAIKVLPDAFAGDPERLARFEREARMLASLNHANIAQIYGVEERALVMELVPGRTLSELIAAGPVPADETLRIVAQIAEALAAAHERGVIHRDLKPANVKITPDGRVKVLDFGLAKLLSKTGAENESFDETVTEAMTRAGTVMGTPAYMSPEQARGSAVDKRTDIWALGCVWFELLTRRRAFAGGTLSDMIAAVLEREPDWDALPPSTPRKVRDLLRRCLRKDVRRRARDAGDIAIQIEEAGAEPAPEPSVGHRPPGARLVPLLMAAIAVAAAFAAGYLPHRLGSSSPAGMIRLSALIAPNERIRGGLCPNIAVSPDGKFVAYIGVRQGTSHLFLRAMDSLEATALPGTEGASDTVFFSPDGQWLGFLQGTPNQLKKISIGGGSPVTLASTQGCGGDWGSEGQIVIGRTDGIYQIPAVGGAPKPLILTNSAKGERGIGLPQLLPGGKSLLFSIKSNEGRQIVAQRLASGERHVLVNEDSLQPELGYVAHYALPGFLIYSQAGSLLAAPFNLERLEMTGPPVPIVRGPGEIGSQFSLSRSVETLVYLSAEPAPPSTLVWVDRKGVEEPVGAAPGYYLTPRISPDGRSVALAADSDMWVYNVARGVLTRITFADDNREPIWTPDGMRITYSANGRLSWSLADGTSHEELLPLNGFRLPTSWSPDGKRLLFMELGPNRQVVVAMLSLLGEHTATPLIQSRFTQGGAVFSPDGRRLAYVSDESGRSEVYVQEFPGPGGKLQVSSQGGKDPVWARQGSELLYRNGDKLMTVSTGASKGFSVSNARMLFEAKYNFNPRSRNYDVSADGQRFVMIKSGGSAPPVTQFNAVLNWVADVKRRTSAK